MPRQAVCRMCRTVFAPDSWPGPGDQCEACWKDGRPFEPGELIECRDATDGIGFLKAGALHTIADIWRDRRGAWRVRLLGSDAGWEARRFGKVTAPQGETNPC